MPALAKFVLKCGLRKDEMNRTTQSQRDVWAKHIGR